MAGRVDFKVGSFDALIDKHGYYLEHYHALQCPCYDLQTGHPDPTCQYCESGWQYYGRQEIQGIITGLQSEKQFIEPGGLLLGTMQLTVKAEVDLGYHDRIVNRKSLIAFSELLIRGTGETDRARFEMVDILRVVGPGGVVYTPILDYEVSAGSIQWTGTGQAPSAGSRYSVAYRMHPTWLVLSHVHVVRDTHIKFRQVEPVHHRLPIQAICKLEYLWEG